MIYVDDIYINRNYMGRASRPEVDLVGADRAAAAREIYYAGSVNWLDRPFDDHDLPSCSAMR